MIFLTPGSLVFWSVEDFLYVCFDDFVADVAIEFLAAFVEDEGGAAFYFVFVS
jgi:hypothetical protein